MLDRGTTTVLLLVLSTIAVNIGLHPIFAFIIIFAIFGAIFVIDRNRILNSKLYKQIDEEEQAHNNNGNSSNSSQLPEPTEPITNLIYGKQQQDGMWMSKQDKQDYLNSYIWKLIRVAIKKRDNNQCRICGSSNDLQIHHIKYDNLGSEQEDDLLTLCMNCHQQIHDKLGYDRRTTFLPTNLIQIQNSKSCIAMIDLIDIQLTNQYKE